MFDEVCNTEASWEVNRRRRFCCSTSPRGASADNLRLVQTFMFIVDLSVVAVVGSRAGDDSYAT